MRAAAIVAMACLLGGADARAACTVAASWPGGGARWQVDMAAVAAAVKDGGCDYLGRDAEASAARQLRDLSALADGPVKALIVTPVDPQRVLLAVDSALAEGRAVIAYDRAIPKPNLLYLSFDAVDVGRLQAEALLRLRPKGRYIILKGDAADPNADLVYRGQRQLLDPLIKKGEIVLVGDSYVADWSAASATAALNRILDAMPGGVDALLAANDEIAGAAIAALEKRGLTDVAVAGQDGEPDALHRIALGTQAMTVWKDGRRLGATAGAVAVALAKGETSPELALVKPWSDGPRKIPLRALLLQGVAVERGDLGAVIDSGWVTRAEVCAGVDPSLVPACTPTYPMPPPRKPAI